MFDPDPTDSTAPPEDDDPEPKIGGAAAPSPATRSAPTKRLPTPRIAFSNQLNILRAYGAVSQNGTKVVDHKEVAAMIAMSADTVSLANPFFADVGLITRAEGGYAVSDEVVAFARVHQWDPEKAAHELAPKFRETWFSELLLSRLSFNPMSETALEIDLGKAAAADTSYRAQLRTLVEYLEAVGLVEIEGGMVRLVAAASNPMTVKIGTAHETDTAMPITASPRPPAAQGLPLLIQGLLQELPTDEKWTREGMDAWLALAKNVFAVVYKIPNEPKGGGS